ncbi:MAG: leucine-rich repeat protein, partial [Clostridia bacterium]|nr:leucine-rich repeat protein [Clostridia bacterium]
ITRIEYQTFYNCNNLASITLPVTLKSVDQYAFWGTAIKNVYYVGSPAQWSRVAIAYNNEPLETAKVTYNYQTE